MSEEIEYIIEESLSPDRYCLVHNYIVSLQQKVEQLENIRKEANELCDEMLSILYHYNDRKVWEDMKDILNKGGEYNVKD